MSPFTDVLALNRFTAAPSRAWTVAMRLESDGHRSVAEAASRRAAAFELACRPRGGIVSAEDLVLMLRQSERNQALSRVARWIVAREVLSFEWQGTIRLPLFQFEGPDLSVHPVVTTVIGELMDVFDDWELMGWFTSPNTWLGNLIPVDALEAIPRAVTEAARVDRFVARG